MQMFGPKLLSLTIWYIYTFPTAGAAFEGFAAVDGSFHRNTPAPMKITGHNPQSITAALRAGAFSVDKDTDQDKDAYKDTDADTDKDEDGTRIRNAISWSIRCVGCHLYRIEGRGCRLEG